MSPLHLKLLTQMQASVRSASFPAGNTLPAISSALKLGREPPTLLPHTTCGTEEQQACAAARKIVHSATLKQEEIVFPSSLARSYSAVLLWEFAGYPSTDVSFWEAAAPHVFRGKLHDALQAVAHLQFSPLSPAYTGERCHGPLMQGTYTGTYPVSRLGRSCLTSNQPDWETSRYSNSLFNHHSRYYHSPSNPPRLRPNKMQL